MKHRTPLSILILAAAIALCAPGAARADNLLRLFPLFQANMLYTDNVYFAANNPIGDFNSNMAAGFYLDVTTPKRYTTLEWATFASLFANRGYDLADLDRAGQAQFARFSDEEDYSAQTKFFIHDWFIRDSPVVMAVTTGNQPPEFAPGFAEFLLANEHVLINTFDIAATHAFNENWYGDASVNQETLSTRAGEGILQSGTVDLMRNVTEKFSLGPGYRFFDIDSDRNDEPNSQVQWPVARAVWRPARGWSLDGFVGPMIAYNTTGVNRTRINPGGQTDIRYDYKKYRFAISGGQEPGINPVVAAGGIYRYGNGTFSWNLTKRITASASAGYYEFLASRFAPGTRLVAFSVGGTERVASWLTLFARFIELRRNYSASTGLPSGVASGQETVGNYYVIGGSIAFEAFRWSWQ